RELHMNMTLARTDPRASDEYESVLFFAEICCRADWPTAMQQNQKKRPRRSLQGRLRTVRQSRPRSADGRTSADDKSPWRFDRSRRRAGCPSRILRRVRAREKACRQDRAAGYAQLSSCQEAAG